MPSDEPPPSSENRPDSPEADRADAREAGDSAQGQGERSRTTSARPQGRGLFLRDSARSLRLAAWWRRFAKLWGFALFCLFVVYLFRDIVLPFVFAMLVAYLLAPLVDRMARVHVGRRTMPRGLAVIILYIGILSFLGLSFVFVIPKLSGDFARLFREAPSMIEKANEEYLPRVGAWIDRHLGAGDDMPPEPAPHRPDPVDDDTIIEPLPDGSYRLDLSNFAFELRPGENEGEYVIAPYQGRAGRTHDAHHTGGRWERSIKQWVEDKVKVTANETQRAIEYGRKFVTAVVSGVWKLILVLMLAAFILIDLQRVRGFMRSLVPESYAGDFDGILKRIDRGLSGVIRGQLIICLVNGVLTYIGLYIFEVKYSLLLAGIAAVMSLIPIFGSFLSSIPIVIIALVSRNEFDLTLGGYVTGWIILIHLVEANFLNPKIMGDAARTHPVLVVFALIAGEHTYGLVGALFAVPVLSIVQVIFVYLRRKEALAGRSRRRGGAAPEDPTEPSPA